MDDFQGSDKIIIQNGDTSVPYHFKLTIATSSERNDGALPYNSTLCSCIVKAKRTEGGADVTTYMVASSTEDGNTIIPRLQFSSNLTAGLYTLTFLVTASVAGTTVAPLIKEYDFSRVTVRENR